MIAVALDPAALPMAVAGRGAGALRRFHALQAGGARDLRLFTDQPADMGVAARPLPASRADLAGLRALWITGLPDARAAELAALARSEGVLVNVEDRPALCDFHSVAEVRRGDLLLTVSTGGASPGLAARIRARLATDYGPEWADRLALLRGHRAAWRRDGRDLAAETDALLQANGWLA
jgi:precorrin-2 dehydrogenase/sirohydrochlorin ferrochelatase